MDKQATMEIFKARGTQEKKKKEMLDVIPVPSTVGELLISYLILEGVTHVFGIPGGGLMHFLVNLKDQDERIKYVICRQETGAAYMADGYYRASGKLGVVAVTTGPGATNALTGVMNAQADGSALLLITGEIDQQFDGKGYLQEGVDGVLDIDHIYNDAAKYSVSLTSPNSANTLIKQAMRDIFATPHNAAHLALPVNVTIEPLPEGITIPYQTSEYRVQSKGSPIGEARKAMKELLKCKRPLIFLGNGCRQAMRNKKVYNEFLKFVETYAIPVMTTPDGKGIFPESHDLSLRVYGMADCLWPFYYLTQKKPAYDGIMVIGSQLGELSTNKWLPLLQPKGGNQMFIQVDLNQQIIARSFPVTHGIVGEASAFMMDMVNLMPEFPVKKREVAERRKFILDMKEKRSPIADPKQYNSDVAPAQPAALMRVLQNNMPQNTKIFVDAGNCVGWAVHYLKINFPSEIFTSLSMGPMGFAVGAVVGGKLACPNDTCIGFTGDGAFMMQGSEISTAAQNKIGAIWMVLYDNNLSMVSQGMEHFMPDKKNPDVWHELYELGAPNLEMYSRGLGAEAYTVNKPSDLALVMPQVLERANNHGVPQVIICNIDRELLPPYYNPMYSPKPAPKSKPKRSSKKKK